MASKMFNSGTLINRAIQSSVSLQSKRFAERKAAIQALRKKYELFQRENEIPVYLKGGLGDKMLFLTTVALATTGYVSSMYLLISMAFGYKK